MKIAFLVSRVRVLQKVPMEQLQCNTRVCLYVGYMLYIYSEYTGKWKKLNH